MRILIISNGHSRTTHGVNISGGDIRWIEIAKVWQSLGHDIHVFTPNSGRDLCRKLSFEPSFHIMNDSIIGSNMVANYVYRSIVSTIFLPKSLRALDPQLVYSATEHYYDVLPACILKSKNKDLNWTAVVHWVAPIKRNGKALINLLFYIQQRIGLILIRYFADHVLAVSTSTACSLGRLGFRGSRLLSVECGVSLDEILSNSDKNSGNIKLFDAMYMKRFHSGKGVFDAVKIWRKVVDEHPSAKLLMVGGSDNDTLDKVDTLIRKHDLSDNVIIAGPVYDSKKKYMMLQQSRTFLLPSYEENWAIVVGEALACGVPVIAYDLPEIKPIWGDTVAWVPLGDINSFARSVTSLLLSPERCIEISHEGRRYIERFSWNRIAMEELKVSFAN